MGLAMQEILIIALISVITIGLVNYFGGYLKDSITKTSCELVGGTYVQDKQHPGNGVCK